MEMKIDKVVERFAKAFGSIRNARIIKRQANNFALKFKYPLLMLICIAVIALLVVFQVILQQFDVIYIVCESIIIVFMVAFIALFAVSWKINLQNASCAEIIEYYYDGETKCLYSTVAGGGSKAEWKEARFYFYGEDQAELFEGGEKIYQPFVYKKVRGHARNFALLSLEALLTNFFENAEVLEEDENHVSLSSGFRFYMNGDRLVRFEIDGMYSECFENNFPIYAPLAMSKSYTFTYEFEEINRENYSMILPEIVRYACDYYFLPLPKANGLYIENNKK